MNCDEKQLIKNELLRCLLVFHNFCEEHNLTYYLLGGTLLGAIRHKGFIPWDDDIDVAMPRKDYEKLLSLQKKIENNTKLRHYSHEKGFIYPFAKLCSTKITVSEPFYKPFTCGLWIDIFPFDYGFKYNISNKVAYSIVKMLRNISIIKNGAFKEKDKTRTTRAFLILNHTLLKLIPSSFIFNLSEKIQKKGKNKNIYINYQGAWGLKESGPVDLLSERRLHSFEEYNFYIFKNYKYWLKKVYGNFMKLPPLEDRLPEHFIEIVTKKIKK